ncbi:hypothetical protein P3L10_024350 [Capsicum annuum]
MKQESSQNGLIDPSDPLIDPNDPKGQLIQFSNAIIFGGKFYAPSLQGTLAVIEEIEDQFQNISLKRSNRVVDNVEVFKLQIDDLSWLKMDNLGDRTLFTGIKCCLSVPASQDGCRNNCVYFTHHSVDGWRLHDMGSGFISPCYDDSGSKIKSPVWEEPVTGKSSR